MKIFEHKGNEVAFIIKVKLFIYFNDVKFYRHFAIFDDKIAESILMKFGKEICREVTLIKFLDCREE